MSELAVGYVSIVPKFGSGFKSAIEQGVGENAGAPVGKKFGTSFKSTFLGVVAGNAITAAIGKVASTVKGAFSGGFNRIMNIDAARAKLNTLAATSKEASKLSGKALKDFVENSVNSAMASVDAAVDGTKFAISDAADMASFLGASGVKAGKDMTRWLTLTADSAQFMNIEFADAQRIVGEVAATGKVTGETLMRMPLAAAALADKLGISQAEVRKLASQGKISAADFVDALEGKIGGAAKNSGALFTSVLANLKTALNATMANLLTPFVRALHPILAALLPVVKGFRDLAKVAGTALGNVLQPKAEAAARSIQRAGDWVTGFSKALRGLDTSRLKGIAVDGAKAFASLQKGLAPIRYTLSTLGDAVKRFADGFIKGFGGLDQVGQAFKNLLPLVMGPLGIIRAALAKVFSSEVLVGARGFGEAVGRALAPVATTVGTIAAGLTKELAGAFAAIVPAAMKVGSALVPVVGQLAKGLAPVASQLVGSILPSVASLLTTIMSALSGLAAQLAPLIAQLVGALVPVLADLVKAVLPPIMQIIDALVPVIKTLVAQLAPLITQLAAQLAPVITQVAKAILPQLANILGIVGKAVGDLVEALAPLVQAIVTALAPVLTSLAQTVLPALGGALSAVLEIISGALTIAIIGIVDFINNVVVPSIKLLTPVVTATLTTISSVIQGALAEIKGIFSVMGALIRGDWSAVWEGIQQIVAGRLETIRAIVAGALNIIVSIFRAAWGAISGGATEAFNSLVGYMSGVPGRIKGALSTLSTLASLAAAWFGGFLRGAQSSLNSTVSFVASIPGRIRAALGNTAAMLIGSGRALINGFTQGIRSAISGAIDAVRGGLAKIRRYLPFSPAKEGPFSGRGYTLYSGQALMGDFAAGIRSRHEEVRRATAEAMRAASIDAAVDVGGSNAATSLAAAAQPGITQHVNVSFDGAIIRDMQTIIDAVEQLQHRARLARA